jgi:hypothetical protein
VDRTPKLESSDPSAIKQTAAATEPRLVELNSPAVPDRQSSWSRLLAMRFGKAKRIPLPRTDLERTEEALAGNADQRSFGSF